VAALPVGHDPAVTAGILAVVLLAVGLPLLAFWVGGRRFWDRTPAARQGDLYRQMVRAHALRPAEIAQVEGAVTWGRELTDPRLRAAVVDWAQRLQQQAADRRTRHARLRRVARGAAVGWLALAVVVLGWGIHDGDWRPVVQVLVQTALIGPVTWVAVRGPRRAIERNSGPPPGS
jgi:hypothetical protein